MKILSNFEIDEPKNSVKAMRCDYSKYNLPQYINFIKFSTCVDNYDETFGT